MELRITNEIKMVDIGIVVVVLLSALVGFIRGVTREILGFISWVGSFFIALYMLPFIRPFLTPYIQSSLLVDLIGGVGAFFVSLIILILVSKLLSSQVKESLLSGIDRSLGAVFGFCRGVVVIALLYLTLTFFLNTAAWPSYLKEARLMSIAQDVAQYIIAFVPEAELPDTIKKHFSTSLEITPPQKVFQDIQTLSILTPFSSSDKDASSS